MDNQNRQQSWEIRPEPCGDEGESSAPQEESADVLPATFSALSEVHDSTLSRWEQEVFKNYRAEQSALVPAATADPVTPTTYGPQLSSGAGNQGLWPLGGMNMINTIEGDDSTQNPFGTTYSTGSAFHAHYRMGMPPCTQGSFPNTVSSPNSSLSPPFRQERHDMPALNPLRSLAHPSDSSAQHPKDLSVSWCTTDGLLERPLALRSDESGETVMLRKRSRYCSDRQWTREATDQVTQKLKPYHKAAVKRKQNTESFVNTVSRAVEDLFRSAPLPQMSSATERLCQEAVNLGFDFTSRSSLVS